MVNSASDTRSAAETLASELERLVGLVGEGWHPGPLRGAALTAAAELRRLEREAREHLWMASAFIVAAGGTLRLPYGLLEELDNSVVVTREDHMETGEVVFRAGRTTERTDADG